MMAIDEAPFAVDFEADNDAAEPYSEYRKEQAEREKEAKAAQWLAHAAEVPSEWYSEAPPKRDWLLRDARHAKARGVFPLGKVGQLIAEGGAGKTLVLCQLAIAIATGTPWLGAFSAPQPGRVLLALGEEDAEESQRRLYRARKASPAIRAPEAGSIVVLPLHGVSASMLELDAYGNLVETGFLRWLRTYVAAGAFSLVVVDPLTRFAGPNAETDNAAGTRFIQALESFASPTTSVLNAHHVNKISRGKDGKLDAASGRGSSSLVDGARWQCALAVEHLKFDGTEEQERFGEIVTFAVTKSNYAVKPDPVLLRRDHDNGGALLPLTQDDQATVDAARTGAALASPKRQARQAEAQSDAAAQDAAVVRAVNESPGINQTALRDRVRALTGCGDPAARVAIARAADRLLSSQGPNRSTLYSPKGHSQ